MKLEDWTPSRRPSFSLTSPLLYEMNMAPKVSVIIPSRLEGSFLGDAIKSVAVQEGLPLADIQIIVGIDYGQAALFQQRFPDLDMAESRGHGQAAALNAAVKQARGK